MADRDDIYFNDVDGYQHVRPEHWEMLRDAGYHMEELGMIADVFRWHVFFGDTRIAFASNPQQAIDLSWEHYQQQGVKSDE